jgi:UDP-N-acetylmuramoyl-tripeptide--D-alanyl-D-alanine ligase
MSGPIDLARNQASVKRKPLRRWTLARVAEVVGATWELPGRVSPEETGAKATLGAALDSRVTRPGEVFVALVGEQVDGHLFVPEARAHGAVAALCRRASLEDLDPSACGPILAVADPEAALAAWGAARRAAWAGTAIGVTGTNGKTTTKDLLALCLSTRALTWATEGNRNNHLGVPVTLTGLSDDHGFAVIEMGMNHRGEIARLCEWARPQAGVITHVGPAHLEGLGSLAEVARAKAELAAALPSDGFLVLPAGLPHLERALEEVDVRARRLTFGVDCEADLVARGVVELGPAGVSFRVEGFPPVRLRLAGRHNVANALAALACARELGVDPGAAVAALAEARPAAGRLAVSVRGGVTLLLDHYNANPDSARAALATLRRWPARRRFAALGEMRELGDYTAQGHREVGEAAAFVDGLYLIGEATAHVAEGARASGLREERVRGFSDVDELAAALGAELAPGDAVLIKGSRATRMERVADALAEQLGGETAPGQGSAGQGPTGQAPPTGAPPADEPRTAAPPDDAPTGGEG